MSDRRCWDNGTHWSHRPLWRRIGHGSDGPYGIHRPRRKCVEHRSHGSSGSRIHCDRADGTDRREGTDRSGVLRGGTGTHVGTGGNNGFSTIIPG